MSTPTRSSTTSATTTISDEETIAKLKIRSTAELLDFNRKLETRTPTSRSIKLIKMIEKIVVERLLVYSVESEQL